eukprot:c20302_g1_i2.p1 GENE.c20302_g1_i2~~c20302_g1_i2.p1  ORF type:complete len:477 (+),score=127.91 c20302_g1_i2:175-1605(+)
MLLKHWARPDVADLLELLSPAFPERVRKYSVENLRAHYRDHPGEVTICLPQLVEACRYETRDDLKELVLQIGNSSLNQATFLFWYLRVACEPKPDETEQQQRQRDVLCRLREVLHQEVQNKPEFDRALRNQVSFVQSLMQMSSIIKEGKEKREEKRRQLREMFEPGQRFAHLANLESELPLPVDPDVIIRGIQGKDVNIFKSAMAPFLLPMKCRKEGMQYNLIFKSGDDLRQDQLVMQIIEIIDRLWQREGLDLKLTKYRVLATSSDSGMVECVPNCEALQAVLTEYNGDINKFLHKKNCSDSGDKKQVVPEFVVQNFIKSTAGYSVISYVLGIGDRHLDNLLLCHDGHLFHIDFGFLFGRDPKPLPPAMKIRSEMVAVMGPEGYNQFKALCCTAFSKLRHSANLIVNLVQLVRDAGLQDMKNPEKVISFLLERLDLSMDDEKVWQHVQDLILKSETSIWPVWMDRIHYTAQKYRS